MKVAVVDLPDLSPGDSQQTSADSTVRVLFLSRFCPDFCLSDRILSEIKKTLSVVCLSVCPAKDETELFGFSVSLSADVCLKC